MGDQLRRTNLDSPTLPFFAASARFFLLGTSLTQTAQSSPEVALFCHHLALDPVPSSCILLPHALTLLLPRTFSLILRSGHRCPLTPGCLSTSFPKGWLPFLFSLSLSPTGASLFRI